MKKIICLLAIVFTAGIIESSSAVHSSFMRPKPIRARLHRTADCDHGFGLCLIRRVEHIETSPYEATAECYYEKNNLILKFLKIDLSDGLMEKFSNEGSIPIEKGLVLTDDLIEYLELPQNAIFKEGQYEIIDSGDFFQITIPIVN